MDSAAAALSVPVGELGQGLSALRLRRPDGDEPMRRSLQQRGQLTALTAFDEGGQLQLVDGFKRLRAAHQLGWQHMRVRVLEHDRTVAIAAIVALHEHHSLSELEEGWVVRSLCREQGLRQGEVAQLLSRHKSWVSRRLLLVEGLDDAVQADVRLGLVSARSALALAALPRGNQRQAAELVMSRGMTTRQAEALVRQLCGLDSDEARAVSIATWPQTQASTEHETVRARPRSAEQTLLADIAALMRLCVRVKVHLLRAPIGVDRPDVTRQALCDLASLLGPLESTISGALTLQDKTNATLAQP